MNLGMCSVKGCDFQAVIKTPTKEESHLCARHWSDWWMGVQSQTNTVAARVAKTSQIMLPLTFGPDSDTHTEAI